MTPLIPCVCRSWKAGIERVSKCDGCSINQFVAMTAAEKLAALYAEDYFLSRAARADLVAFDRIMSRAGGELPRKGNEWWGFVLLYFEELLALVFIGFQA